MCKLSRETVVALHQCEQRAIALFYAAKDTETCGEHRTKSLAALNEEFGEDIVDRMFRNGIGNNPGPKPAATPTFIANTTDGIPVYWGKKDPSDMESRDLTLWLTAGYPAVDGGNYRRVPGFLEAVGTNMSFRQTTWDSLIATIVAHSHSGALLQWEGA